MENTGIEEENESFQSTDTAHSMTDEEGDICALLDGFDENRKDNYPQNISTAEKIPRKSRIPVPVHDYETSSKTLIGCPVETAKKASETPTPRSRIPIRASGAKCINAGNLARQTVPLHKTDVESENIESGNHKQAEPSRNAIDIASGTKPIFQNNDETDKRLTNGPGIPSKAREAKVINQESEIECSFDSSVYSDIQWDDIEATNGILSNKKPESPTTQPFVGQKSGAVETGADTLAMGCTGHTTSEGSNNDCATPKMYDIKNPETQLQTEEAHTATNSDVISAQRCLSPVENIHCKNVPEKSGKETKINVSYKISDNIRRYEIDKDDRQVVHEGMDEDEARNYGQKHDSVDKRLSVLETVRQKELPSRGEDLCERPEETESDDTSISESLSLDPPTSLDDKSMNGNGNDRPCNYTMAMDEQGDGTNDDGKDNNTEIEKPETKSWQDIKKNGNLSVCNKSGPRPDSITRKMCPGLGPEPVIRQDFLQDNRSPEGTANERRGQIVPSEKTSNLQLQHLDKVDTQSCAFLENNSCDISPDSTEKQETANNEDTGIASYEMRKGFHKKLKRAYTLQSINKDSVLYMTPNKNEDDDTCSWPVFRRRKIRANTKEESPTSLLEELSCKDDYKLVTSVTEAMREKHPRSDSMEKAFDMIQQIAKESTKKAAANPNKQDEAAIENDDDVTNENSDIPIAPSEEESLTVTSVGKTLITPADDSSPLIGPPQCTSTTHERATCERTLSTSSIGDENIESGVPINCSVDHQRYEIDTKEPGKRLLQSTESNSMPCVASRGNKIKKEENSTEEMASKTTLNQNTYPTEMTHHHAEGTSPARILQTSISEGDITGSDSETVEDSIYRYKREIEVLSRMSDLPRTNISLAETADASENTSKVKGPSEPVITSTKEQSFKDDQNLVQKQEKVYLTENERIDLVDNSSQEKDQVKIVAQTQQQDVLKSVLSDNCWNGNAIINGVRRQPSPTSKGEYDLLSQHSLPLAITHRVHIQERKRNFKSIHSDFYNARDSFGSREPQSNGRNRVSYITHQSNEINRNFERCASERDGLMSNTEMAHEELDLQGRSLMNLDKYKAKSEQDVCQIPHDTLSGLSYRSTLPDYSDGQIWKATGSSAPEHHRAATVSPTSENNSETMKTFHSHDNVLVIHGNPNGNTSFQAAHFSDEANDHHPRHQTLNSLQEFSSLVENLQKDLSRQTRSEPASRTMPSSAYSRDDVTSQIVENSSFSQPHLGTSSLADQVRMVESRGDVTSTLEECSIHVIAIPLSRGLGITLEEGSHGVHVGEVLAAGDASHDGRLLPGDRLLAIDDYQLEDLSLQQAKAVLCKLKRSLNNNNYTVVRFERDNYTNALNGSIYITDPSLSQSVTLPNLLEDIETPGSKVSYGDPSSSCFQGDMTPVQCSTPLVVSRGDRKTAPVKRNKLGIETEESRRLPIPSSGSCTFSPKVYNQSRTESPSSTMALQPGSKVHLSKLEAALEFLGLRLSDGQKLHLRYKLHADDGGFVLYKDFVSLVRRMYQGILLDQSARPRNCHSSFTTKPVSPLPDLVPQSATIHSSNVEIETLFAEKDCIKREVYNLKNKINEKAQVLQAVQHELAGVREDLMIARERKQRLQKEAARAESDKRNAVWKSDDYESAIKLLEKDIASLKTPQTSHASGVVLKCQEVQKQINNLVARLRKMERSKRNYFTATQKLMKFACQVYEVLRDESYSRRHGSMRSLPSSEHTYQYVPGCGPSPALSRPNKMNKRHRFILEEATKTINTARGLLAGEPLPFGWEEAYTETGVRYYINHLHGRTTWQNPSSQSATAKQTYHRHR